MSLSKEELLKSKFGIWICNCMNNTGKWESETLQEGINTAHWACEGDGIIATASNIIDGKKYLIKIKRKAKSDIPKSVLKTNN